MSNRPNIVFILPDQLRPDFLSTYGASFIDTPNIDKIAEEGSGTPAPTQGRLQSAYRPAPHCSQA